MFCDYYREIVYPYNELLLLWIIDHEKKRMGNSNLGKDKHSPLAEYRTLTGQPLVRLLETSWLNKRLIALMNTIWRQV